MVPQPEQMPQQAAPMPPKWHDVTVAIKKEYACARVEAVPPEEFGIGRFDKTVKTANYCYHETRKTQTDLIAQGYDADQIKVLPEYSGVGKIEEIERDTVEEHMAGSGNEGVNRDIRLILITEHYTRMDYEGEGKTALYRITTGGEQYEILKRNKKPDIERVDFMPFAAMTPVPVTHRFFGRSVADLVMDIQRIKTALIRATLDNAYLAVNPRAEVAETMSSENTLDDMLVSRPGGIVRVKQPGAVTWQQVPSIASEMFPVIQYMDATREWRTGVSRQGQGVDPNALQNQVATIANQMENASQAKMKLIARIFAETGIRDLFSLLHAVIRKNGSQRETVQLRNQWVEVNPRDWNNRDDMTINVGLGTGSKTERAAQITNIMNIQKEAMLGGLPIVSPKDVYNTASELLKIVGIRSPQGHFTDPDSPEGQQLAQMHAQKPDPKLMQIQMQGQIAQQADQRKAQIEQVQAQADIQSQTAKSQAEMAQNDRKSQMEAQLALLEHQARMAEITAESQRRHEQHHLEMQSRIQQHEFAKETHQMTLQKQREAPRKASK